VRQTRRSLLASSLFGLSGCLGTVEEPSVECPPAVDDSETHRIGLAGDVMLGRNVDEMWHDRDPTGIWGPFADRLRSLDGFVLNLECCVSKRGDRTPGRGFYFRADPDWAIPALNRVGVTAAGLANNHVLDYGPTALDDTLDYLTDAGIGAPGAGEDRSAAFEPALVTAGDLDLAVVAATDQAPSYAARPHSPGTAFAPLDPDDPVSRQSMGTALETARESDPDLVVASLHWGPNWETEPSETHQAFARWLVDHGVDVVLGHSAHTIQGIELYRGRPIIYDAGDFVDDYAVKEAYHNDRSFLFELRVEDGALAALDLVPTEIERATVTEADADAASWLRDRVRTLSEPFGTEIERRGDGLRVPLGGC